MCKVWMRNLLASASGRILGDWRMGGIVRLELKDCTILEGGDGAGDDLRDDLYSDTFTTHSTYITITSYPLRCSIALFSLAMYDMIMCFM